MARFKTDFLKRLRMQVYTRFAKDLAEVCEGATLETESQKILSLVSEISTSTGIRRVNPYVKAQNVVYAEIKDEMAVLKRVLKRCSDDSEAEAYEILLSTMKSAKNRGKKETVDKIVAFLDGLGDMEFDSIVATQISIIRILSARFSDQQRQKNEMRDEIKARRSASAARSELHAFVELVCAQLQVIDASGKSNYCTSVDNILAQYHAEFVRHSAEVESGDVDPAAEQSEMNDLIG